MNLKFRGDIWFWNGPSPFHFVTVPEAQCRELRTIAATVSYGWGMVPVTAQIAATEWTTSLFPKDGRYLVPVKDRVRKAAKLDVGDVVSVRLSVDETAAPGRRRPKPSRP